MSKFFKLEVVKKSVAEVYVEMPDDADPIKMMDYAGAGLAAKETTEGYDWNEFGWEKDVEVISAMDVTEEEARQFNVFDGVNC